MFILIRYVLCAELFYEVVCNSFAFNMTGRKKNYIFRSEMFSLYCHPWVHQRENIGMTYFLVYVTFLKLEKLKEK
jgi:hypothetical protein